MGTKTILRLMDGRPFAMGMFFTDVVDSPWEWVVRMTCEEHDCKPDDVDCIDWSANDPEDYKGLDAGCDKIAVNGKIVGYIS